MKKYYLYLITSLFFLTVSPCYALDLFGQKQLAMTVAGDMTMAVGKTSSSECSGKLICQNFNTPGTGYDNGESWTPTVGTSNVVSPVDTTGPAGSPMRGIQDLLITKGGASTPTLQSASWSSTGSIYLHTLFAFSAAPVSNGTFIILRSSTSNIVQVKIDTDSKLSITCNSSHVGSHALSANTIYHIWVTYITGSGTSTCNVYYSAIGTYSRGSVEAGSTTDSATSNVNNMQFMMGQSISVWFDQLLISTTDTVSPVNP